MAIMQAALCRGQIKHGLDLRPALQTWRGSPTKLSTHDSRARGGRPKDGQGDGGGDGDDSCRGGSVNGAGRSRRPAYPREKF